MYAATDLRSYDVLQFHDYHGVVSLMYLSEAAKPSVMYVAHNADYNGAWALGSAARERYLYSMFNLPISRETRMCVALLTCRELQTLQWHVAAGRARMRAVLHSIVNVPTNRKKCACALT